MKKIVLTMVAMISLSYGYAKTKSFNHEQFKMSFVQDKEARFDMSVDMRRLAATLDLNDEQMETVEAILNCFNNDMQSAASVRGPQCRHLVHEAVSKDIHRMHRVLNDKQFNTYMILLGTTLRNRGL